MSFSSGVTMTSVNRDWRNPDIVRIQRGMVAMVAARRILVTTSVIGRSTAGIGGSITSACSRWSIVDRATSEPTSCGRICSK